MRLYKEKVWSDGNTDTIKIQHNSIIIVNKVFFVFVNSTIDKYT
jgi:hypothetical protein